MDTDHPAKQGPFSRPNHRLNPTARKVLVYLKVNPSTIELTAGFPRDVRKIGPAITVLIRSTVPLPRWMFTLNVAIVPSGPPFPGAYPPTPPIFALTSAARSCWADRDDTARRCLSCSAASAVRSSRSWTRRRSFTMAARAEGLGVACLSRRHDLGALRRRLLCLPCRLGNHPGGCEDMVMAVAADGHSVDAADVVRDGPVRSTSRNHI